MKARVNLQIRAPEVRLVSENGKDLGLFSREQALEMVRRRGEDLVEIGPEAVPPVCQMIDYGKYRYRLQEARKGRSAT
ncbi:Translation initiation factor IF-3 (fragment) [Verrucomicrobia bacterium]